MRRRIGSRGRMTRWCCGSGVWGRCFCAPALRRWIDTARVTALRSALGDGFYRALLRADDPMAVANPAGRTARLAAERRAVGDRAASARLWRGGAGGKPFAAWRAEACGESGAGAAGRVDDAGGACAGAGEARVRVVRGGGGGGDARVCVDARGVGDGDVGRRAT
ncbi:hypothetical protein Ddc_22992 [Ditylenchus destructor]|nr:hypothetical protein Ddc_22992 [Ditylenchus destructor]